MQLHVSNAASRASKLEESVAAEHCFVSPLFLILSSLIDCKNIDIQLDPGTLSVTTATDGRPIVKNASTHSYALRARPKKREL
jgi:hypothetical protein